MNLLNILFIVCFIVELCKQLLKEDSTSQVKSFWVTRQKSSYDRSVFDVSLFRSETDRSFGRSRRSSCSKCIVYPRRTFDWNKTTTRPAREQTFSNENEVAMDCALELICFLSSLYLFPVLNLLFWWLLMCCFLWLCVSCVDIMAFNWDCILVFFSRGDLDEPVIQPQNNSIPFHNLSMNWSIPPSAETTFNQSSDDHPMYNSSQTSEYGFCCFLSKYLRLQVHLFSIHILLSCYL